MPQVRWEVNGQVTIDANGNGTVIINGPKPGQHVVVGRVQVQVTNSLRMSACNVYKGNANDYNIVSGTATGNRDTDDAPNVDLFPGEFLTAVWSLADPGAIASIYVTGMMTYGL